jgi:hypothetical protein
MQQRHPEPQRLAALLLTVALLAACTSPGPRYASWQVETPIAARPVTATPGSIDFHGIPLRDGQLVVSEQGSPLGLLMALLVDDAAPWIHAGIISIEDGVPWLYESNGQLQPAWSGPPTATVSGGMRRMTLEWFVANQTWIAIYDPPAGADPAKIVAFARQSHAQHIPFDAYFDLGDASRMYCTEFVALALASADAPPVRSAALSPNRSIRVIADWLQLRADKVIPAGALIEHGERVALISKGHSPAQTSAWFALRQELHRRFTPDQKVGNVLSFSPISGLDFQPPVRDLIRSVDVAARDWSNLAETEIDAHVRRIAGERLGPYPEE